YRRCLPPSPVHEIHREYPCLANTPLPCPCFRPCCWRWLPSSPSRRGLTTRSLPRSRIVLIFTVTPCLPALCRGSAPCASATTRPPLPIRPTASCSLPADGITLSVSSTPSAGEKSVA